MLFEIALSAAIGVAVVAALFFTVEARKRSRRRRQHNAGLNRMAAIHGLLTGLGITEGVTQRVTNDGLVVVMRRQSDYTEVAALHMVERAEGSTTAEGALYRIADTGSVLYAPLNKELASASEALEAADVQSLSPAPSWMLARLERNLLAAFTAPL